MRKFGFALLLVAIVIIILTALVYMPGAKKFFQPPGTLEQRQSEDFLSAQKLLEEGHPNQALNIIRKHRSEIESNTEFGKKWMDLFIDASVEILDTPQLLILYEYRPEAFDTHEKAVLIVGDAYILTGKGKEYEELRKRWNNKETLDQSWLILDSDKLVLDGSRQEAINLLNSKTFEGYKDTGRLVRLALMYLNEDPKKSWDYFSQAMEKDPKNTNLRLYRARLLEGIGKENLALSEYLSAIQADSENKQLRDELANFFLRNRQYAQAEEVLTQMLNEGNVSEGVWLKAWFWGKVAVPSTYKWDSPIPAGNIQPLLEYFATLKPWQFWNAQDYEAVPNGQNYLKREQSTFWLRLIHALNSGNVNEARNLLTYNTFSEESWNSELELLLKLIINYQQNNNLNIEESGMSITPKEKLVLDREPRDTAHPFFKQLRQLYLDQKNNSASFVMPAEMDKFLKSELAIPSAFLATGWLETAIALQKLKIIPQDFPEWVAYGFTQALRFNRNSLEALSFAKSQHPSPELSLLIGELYIAEKSPDAAIEQLEQLATQNDQIGQRAAWLISLIDIDRQEYDKAKQQIENNPALRDSVQGKETLARIALLQNDPASANQLYESIADKSSEAKSFLARKAFAEKNWQKAREYTIELLKEYPNNVLLRENLMKIEEEQKGAVPAQEPGS